MCVLLFSILVVDCQGLNIMRYPAASFASVGLEKAEASCIFSVQIVGGGMAKHCVCGEEVRPSLGSLHTVLYCRYGIVVCSFGCSDKVKKIIMILCMQRLSSVV